MRRWGAIVLNDLRLEWRRPGRVAAIAVFALLAGVVFVLASDPEPEPLARLGPGAFWVAILFAGTLGLGKTFAEEERDDAMTALLLSPVDRSALFLAKAASTALFLLAVEVVMAPVFFAMFGLPLLRVLPGLAALAALATAGLALLGTLLAFLTARAAGRELLLPVLLLPLVLPLLVAAARGTRVLLASPVPALADLSAWLTLMAAFDVVFAVLGCWGFERAVEE
ncbi:MAG TPA: heme exporter protein CcmB [Gemmatimonadota bacterium]